MLKIDIIFLVKASKLFPGQIVKSPRCVRYWLKSQTQAESGRGLARVGAGSFSALLWERETNNEYRAAHKERLLKLTNRLLDWVMSYPFQNKKEADLKTFAFNQNKEYDGFVGFLK